MHYKTVLKNHYSYYYSSCTLMQKLNALKRIFIHPVSIRIAAFFSKINSKPFTSALNNMQGCSTHHSISMHWALTELKAASAKFPHPAQQSAWSSLWAPAFLRRQHPMAKAGCAAVMENGALAPHQLHPFSNSLHFSHADDVEKLSILCAGGGAVWWCQSERSGGIKDGLQLYCIQRHPLSAPAMVRSTLLAFCSPPNPITAKLQSTFPCSGCSYWASCNNKRGNREGWWWHCYVQQDKIVFSVTCRGRWAIVRKITI